MACIVKEANIPFRRSYQSGNVVFWPKVCKSLSEVDRKLTDKLQGRAIFDDDFETKLLANGYAPCASGRAKGYFYKLGQDGYPDPEADRSLTSQLFRIARTAS